MTVGDIYGDGTNSLIVLTSEGYCNIFDIKPSSNEDKEINQNTSSENILDHNYSSPHDTYSVGIQSANASATNSYDPESLMSHESDHPLLDYNSPPTTYPATLPKPIRSHSFSTNDGTTVSERSQTTQSRRKSTNFHKVEDKIQPSSRWRVVGNATCVMLGDIDETGKNELIIGSSDRFIYVYTITDSVDQSGNAEKALILRRKWRLPGQVISLSMFNDNWGRPVVLATQQEGCYTTIDHKGTMKFYKASHNPSTVDTFEEDQNGPSEIIYVRRSPLSKDGTPQDPVLFLISYMDGSIKMQEESGKLLWEMQLDRQLFPIKSLDITQDGDQDVVISSWDGMTYIIDQSGNCIQTKFNDRIRAFTAGHYSPSSKQTYPCLVYLTFSDQMFIYYNIGIHLIQANSLTSYMETQIHEIHQRIDPQSEISDQEFGIPLLRSLLYDPYMDEKNLRECIKILNSCVKK